MLVQLTLATALAAPARDAAAPKPAAVSPDGPEVALKQAMPADAVRTIMGKPLEIKSMKVPNGKAEVWVYRRQISTREDRIVIGTTPVMMAVEDNNHVTRQIVTGQTVQYGDVHYVTDAVVELLMYNDQFVTLKKYNQESKRYN